MTESKSQTKEKKVSQKSQQRKRRVVPNGIIHIFASFNNTIVTASDEGGNILCWSSSGKHGFKGSRKSTPYAAQVATQQVLSVAKDFGMQNAVVKVNGPGVGREAALRAIQSSGLIVSLISDLTYHPHNGCRPAKRRRV